MEVVVEVIQSVYNNFGGVTIIGLVCLLLYAMRLAHQRNKIIWSDLVTSKGTNKVSLTKFLQLIGGITGTWIVIYLTLHEKLTYDMLMVYLVYVGAIDGWSKFISAKYNIHQSNIPETKPPESATSKESSTAVSPNK